MVMEDNVVKTSRRSRQSRHLRGIRDRNLFIWNQRRGLERASHHKKRAIEIMKDRGYKAKSQESIMWLTDSQKFNVIHDKGLHERAHPEGSF